MKNISGTLRIRTLVVVLAGLPMWAHNTNRVRYSAPCWFDASANVYSKYYRVIMASTRVLEKLRGLNHNTFVLRARPRIFALYKLSRAVNPLEIKILTRSQRLMIRDSSTRLLEDVSSLAFSSDIPPFDSSVFRFKRP